MSANQIDHLVKMVNQIALNFASVGDEEQIAEQTFGHIKKFWSPLMKQQIVDYQGGAHGELSAAAAKAVLRLRRDA